MSGIATTSGRARITSRTTVSPNSKTEWMSSSSSSSIEPSSEPAEAICRISSSLTNGPCRSPFPGRITFASPMRAFVGRSRTRATAYANGASASATRSVWRTPYVFAIASTTTKYRSVNAIEVSVTPRESKRRSARIATTIADPFCTTITAR